MAARVTVGLIKAVFVIVAVVVGIRAASAADAYQTSVPHAILVDYDSGSVLFEKAADVRGAAGQPDQDDDDGRGVPGHQGRQDQPRRRVRHLRARLAPRRRAVGRLGDVRHPQQPGEAVRPDPGRHRAVGQRRRHRHRRRADGQRAGLRPADERSAPRKSAWPAPPSATRPAIHDPDQKISARDIAKLAALHHPQLSRNSTRSTASATSPGTRSSSRTAIRCSPWASAPTG